MSTRSARPTTGCKLQDAHLSGAGGNVTSFSASGGSTFSCYLEWVSGLWGSDSMFASGLANTIQPTGNETSGLYYVEFGARIGTNNTGGQSGPMQVDLVIQNGVDESQAVAGCFFQSGPVQNYHINGSTLMRLQQSGQFKTAVRVNSGIVTVDRCFFTAKKYPE